MLAGCSTSYNEESLLTEYKELSVTAEENLSNQIGLEIDDSNRITDEAMLDDFIKLYALTSLTSQELLWQETDNILQMEFYFNNEVSASEIDAARSFVLNKFVLGIINNNSITAYEYWMQKDGQIRTISAVKCRVFIDEQLIFQENYENQKITGYYENQSVIVNARLVSSDEYNDLAEFVKKELANSSVTVQKSISGDILIILIQSDKLLPISSWKKIQAFIEETMLGQFGTYTDITLSMSNKNGVYFNYIWNDR